MQENTVSSHKEHKTTTPIASSDSLSASPDSITRDHVKVSFDEIRISSSSSPDALSFFSSSSDASVLSSSLRIGCQSPVTVRETSQGLRIRKEIETVITDQNGHPIDEDYTKSSSSSSDDGSSDSDIDIFDNERLLKQKFTAYESYESKKDSYAIEYEHLILGDDAAEVSKEMYAPMSSDDDHVTDSANPKPSTDDCQESALPSDSPKRDSVKPTASGGYKSSPSPVSMTDIASTSLNITTSHDCTSALAHREKNFFIEATGGKAEVIETSDGIFLEMSQVGNINLENYLDPIARKSNPLLAHVEPLSFIKRLEIIIQVINALQQLHSKGIIHRDINTTQLMLNLDEGKIADINIIDYGSAKYMTEKESDIPESLDPATKHAILYPGTTAFYEAPEIIQHFDDLDEGKVISRDIGITADTRSLYLVIADVLGYNLIDEQRKCQKLNSDGSYATFTEDDINLSNYKNYIEYYLEDDFSNPSTKPLLQQCCKFLHSAIQAPVDKRPSLDKLKKFFTEKLKLLQYRARISETISHKDLVSIIHETSPQLSFFHSMPTTVSAQEMADSVFGARFRAGRSR